MAVTKHFWERVPLRVRFKAVRRGLKDLQRVDLPKGKVAWYYPIEGGYIAGRGKVVVTVLAASMKPYGIRLMD